MGMGIVSDEDLFSEIENLKPRVIEAEVIDKSPLGRGTNNVAVPESLQKIIGETSEIEGRKEALALAAQFNISPSSVSAYANGAASTKSYDKPKTNLLNHINQAKERISKKARTRLHYALNSITEEKVNSAKLKDIALVARSMSAIIKDMEPEKINEIDESNRPTFVVFAPQLRDERHYEVVIARE